MPAHPRIHIIGCGIAGLTTALALQRAGLEVSLFEQARELGEAGAGLTLGPNATRVLIHLGLGEALAPYVHVPRHSGVADYHTGEVLTRGERGRWYEATFGAPFWQLHRADLVRVLAAALRPGTPLHLHRRLVNVSQGAGGIRATFAGGRQTECDLLIACDGIRSQVRESVFGATPPEFTGYVAYRGLAERARLAERAIDPDFLVSLAPGRLFARYAVRRRSLVNLVGIAAQPDWREEHWRAPAARAEVEALFGDAHAGVRSLLAALRDEACFKWALHVRPPIGQWVRGGIALLGDAAHPMTPFLGLGAAIAIEDAIVLARALAGEDEPRAALARYQAARVPRARRAQEESSRQGLYLLNPGGGRPGDRYLLGEDALGLFGYDALSTPL